MGRLLLVLLLLAGPVLAAEPASDAIETAAPATLTVMNRDLIEFRASLLGNAPAQRAEAAAARIEALLELQGPGQVTLEPLGELLVIKLDGKLAFGVAAGDANPLHDQSQAEVAAAAVTAFERVVSESAEAHRQPEARAVGLALGMTVAWLLVLLLLRAGRQALERWAQARAEAHARGIRVGGAALLDRTTVRGFVAGVLKLVYLAIVLLASYEWLGLVLQVFPYTRPWGEHLAAFLIGFGKDILIATAHAAPGLFIVIVIFFIARGVAGFGEAFFTRVQRGEVKVGWIGSETALPTRRLFVAFVWLFALAIAYPHLPGSGSDAFKGLSVLVGLMFSLGGASTIGQAASGLILMYGRSFKVGEYVRIGDQEGTVSELGAFQTRLRTGMGVEVVMPNGAVIGSVIHNYSRVVTGQGFVVDAMVTIGYDAPWRQVHALLAQAAAATEGVLKEPKPQVFQTALSDFYVEYRLVCVASAEQPRPRAEVMSLLHANIQDAFHGAGVQIMSPHYFADPASPKIPKG